MNTEIWLCEITGQPVALHDCLECAEHRRLPACPFPPTVLKALANSMRADDGLLEAQALAQRAGVALLRVTGLLGCTRQAWYSLHASPPLEKPSEHWSRLRGTIFHAALESLAGENAVAETRLIASLEELGARAWIAGKIDHYDPALRLATDYKTINSFGKKMVALDLPKQHHIAQLWIYAWLLGKAGYPYPLAGRVVYMDMGAVRTVDVAMPDEDMQAAVEARLVEKARLITEAGPNGPAGDPQEAWQCAYCGFAAQCPDRIKPQTHGSAGK
jgi:CRISPR/Cas system-associated exonuclease Cas4 (RecB family)